MLADLSEEEKEELKASLRKKHPNAPEQFLLSFTKQGLIEREESKRQSFKTRLNRLRRKYDAEAKRNMKRISKHINTQQFNEYFAEHITPMSTAMALKEILEDSEERTENRLKAIQEIHKYTMVPSQAQEIRHEIDDSWSEDKEDRLKQLVKKAVKDSG